MHFPPIPPPLATLQTAGPARPCCVITLGHFGVSQSTQGPAPNPFSLPPAEPGLFLWQSKGKSKTEEIFAHHLFGFNKTSQPAIWYQMSKGVCLQKYICTYWCTHIQTRAQVYNLQFLDYNIYHLECPLIKSKTFRVTSFSRKI